MVIIRLKVQAFTIYFKHSEQMNSFLTSHKFDFKKVAWALLFRLVSPSYFTSILIVIIVTSITRITEAIIISVIFTMSI